MKEEEARKQAAIRMVEYGLKFLSYKIVNGWIYIENIPVGLGNFIRKTVEDLHFVIVSAERNEDGNYKYIKVEGFRGPFDIAKEISDAINEKYEDYVIDYYEDFIY